MANMKDIARLAGVSTATVSHVLSGKAVVREETRRRVEEAVRQTGYTLNPIAKSLRMNRTHTIGVLVEDIRGLPVPEIVTGISEYLEKQGYQLMLNNLRLLERLYNQYGHILLYREEINQGVEMMLRAHVDGIIYVAMHDRPLEDVLLPVDKPLVYAYASAGDGKNPCITYDNQGGAGEIARLFLAKGHRRIAVIAGHRDSQPSQKRLNSFVQAVEEAGLSMPPEYIRWADWDDQSAALQMAELLSLPQPPSAVFALNDVMAAGCYHAVRLKGLAVPGDVSIAGFDNTDISRYLSPPLTTMALPTRSIGYQSAKTLLAMLEKGAKAQENRIIPCTLCSRESVGPPRRR